MGLFNAEQAKVVYISYILDDIYYASIVADYLRNVGYKVVSTPYQASKNLDELCSQITESADAVVSIASPSAARTQRFWADMANARMNETPVLPLAVHKFVDGAPMEHYINASDDVQHGCRRLEAALERAGAYRDNFVGKRQPLVKRILRSVVTAAAVAAFAIFGALFS
jgi:hypothetical protein